MITEKKIKKSIDNYKLMFKKENHSYLSWETCYRNFRSRNNNDEMAALHLGFYLASWGMLRGSSQLLKMHYRCFIPVIKILRYKKYKTLQDLKFLNFEKNIGLIDKLYIEIKECLNIELNKNKEGKKYYASDILITKIILGTLACGPALDRFFKAGFKQIKVKRIITDTKAITPLTKSLRIVFEFFKKNKNGYYPNFETEIRELIKDKKGIVKSYPEMKMLDMFFFSIGKFSKKQKPSKIN